MTVVAVAILQITSNQTSWSGGPRKSIGYKVVCNLIILLGSYLITRVLITL